MNCNNLEKSISINLDQNLTNKNREEIINEQTNLSNQLETCWNNNTTTKITKGNLKYDKLILIKDTKELMKNSELKLKKLNIEERALKKKLKNEIYISKDTDNINFYYSVIKYIHFGTLLIAILGIIDTLIPKIVVIILILIMYSIMVSIYYTKILKDKYRDTNDYNTFHLKKKDNKICKFNNKN